MEYVPIMRLRQTESQVLWRVNGKPVFPLLEIVDQKVFDNFSITDYSFKQGIMFDLPCYLMESDNKYFGGVLKMFNSLTATSNQLKQAEFYKKNAKSIGIPVVSAQAIRVGLDYGDLVIGYNALDKKTLPKIAVRVFVSSIDLSSKNINSFKKLVTSLRDSDIILLDIVEFDGVESNVVKNLEMLVKLIPLENKKKTFILNAFDVADWRKDVHLYAPLLSKLFGLAGFGDFATMPRTELAGGGGGTTSVIRYTVGWEKKLIHSTSLTDFKDAKKKLKNKTVWTDAKANGHFNNCNPCKEIDVLDTEWKTFWKMFRIEHHVNVVLSNVLPDYVKYTKPDDFDMHGYDAIYKNTDLKG